MNRSLIEAYHYFLQSNEYLQFFEALAIFSYRMYYCGFDQVGGLDSRHKRAFYSRPNALETGS